LNNKAGGLLLEVDPLLHRQVLLSPHIKTIWYSDPDAYLVAFEAEYGDGDVIADLDGFSCSPG
jgi:hypothetical protein